MSRPVDLAYVERFMRATGWGPTRFGREVANDAKLVPDMRKGRTLTPAMQETIRRFVEDHVDRLKTQLTVLKMMVK